MCLIALINLCILPWLPASMANAIANGASLETFIGIPPHIGLGFFGDGE